MSGVAQSCTLFFFFLHRCVFFLSAFPKGTQHALSRGWGVAQPKRFPVKPEQRHTPLAFSGRSMLTDRRQRPLVVVKCFCSDHHTTAGTSVCIPMHCSVAQSTAKQAEASQSALCDRSAYHSAVRRFGSRYTALSVGGYWTARSTAT